MTEEASVKKAIWESAKEIFDTMIFLPVKELDGQYDPSNSAESLICTITFTGKIQGSFSTLCDVENAQKIARAMLMLEADAEISQTDTCDALGEVTNMIIGGLKSRLSDAAKDMQIFIPATIKGMEIQQIIGKNTKKVNLAIDVDGKTIKIAMMYKLAA